MKLFEKWLNERTKFMKRAVENKYFMQGMQSRRSGEIMKRIGISILFCSYLGCCPVNSYVGIYYNNYNGCEQVLKLNEDKTYKYLATYEGKKIEDYGKWEPSKAQNSCRVDIYHWEYFEPYNWGYEYVKKAK